MLERCTVFVSILVVAAVAALGTAVHLTRPSWLVLGSPIAPFLPAPGTGPVDWLAATAGLVGVATGPLVLAALLLRRSPAAGLGRVLATIATLLAPALVAVALWSLTPPASALIHG